jgi:hypothetical protein
MDFSDGSSSSIGIPSSSLREGQNLMYFDHTTILFYTITGKS